MGWMRRRVPTATVQAPSAPTGRRGPVRGERPAAGTGIQTAGLQLLALAHAASVDLGPHGIVMSPKLSHAAERRAEGIARIVSAE